MVPHLHVAEEPGEQGESRCCDGTQGPPVKPFSLHWGRSFSEGLGSRWLVPAPASSLNRGGLKGIAEPGLRPQTCSSQQ